MTMVLHPITKGGRKPKAQTPAAAAADDTGAA
jgi:hypothetical protein